MQVGRCYGNKKLVSGPCLLLLKAESLYKSSNYIKTSLLLPVFNTCISATHCGDPKCSIQYSTYKLTCMRDLHSAPLVLGCCPRNYTNLSAPSPCPFLHRCNRLSSPYFLECVHFPNLDIYLKHDSKQVI